MTDFNANLAVVSSAYANKIFVSRNHFPISYKRSLQGKLFVKVTGRYEESRDPLMPSECMSDHYPGIRHTEIIIPAESVVLADTCFYTSGLPCLEIANGLFEEAFPYVCNTDIETYADMRYPTGDIERIATTHPAGTMFLAKGRATTRNGVSFAKRVYYRLPGENYNVI